MQNNVVCLHPFLMSRVVEYHVITVPLGEDREVKMSELFTVSVFSLLDVIQVCL